MPKTTKSTTRKTKAPTTRAKKEPRAKAQWSPEYEDYLERYELMGEGRPRLAPKEFDKLDDELLDLLELSNGDLTDDQVVRIQELEFLLIDSE